MVPVRKRRGCPPRSDLHGKKKRDALTLATAYQSRNSTAVRKEVEAMELYLFRYFDFEISLVYYLIGSYFIHYL